MRFSCIQDTQGNSPRMSGMFLSIQLLRTLTQESCTHALTGCDTTSSFFKIGKQTAFNKLSQNIECVGKLSEFGDFSAGVNTVVQLVRSFLLSIWTEGSVMQFS